MSDDVGEKLHVLGAKCELAARVYFGNIAWIGYTEDSIHGSVDLGTFIDVKGAPLAWHRLLIKPGEVKSDVAYLLVCAERAPLYQMKGWFWGRDVKREHLKELKTGRACYVIDHDELKRPDELLTLAIERGETSAPLPASVAA